MKKLLILLAFLTPVAHAEEMAAEPRTGDETRAWIELQKSGSASVAAARPMTGEVADKVYKRYVDSFGHPIPDTFQREDFVSGN
jgi:hypothetical protein